MNSNDSNRENDEMSQVSAYILEKLANIYNLKQRDALQKIKTSLEGEEMKQELEHLVMISKRPLIVGLNKDGNLIKIKKESRYVKKTVLILKACKEDPLSEDMDQNFIFIELSKNILDQIYVIW